MQQSSKGSKRKPKSPESFQNLIEQNRAKNRALKKLLKFIEDDVPQGTKAINNNPNHE
jgi:hypothetical protein